MTSIYVIGNGPSLAEAPLEQLAGERCFATNKIHLIYPRTTWRPTDYFLTDWLHGTRWWEWLEENAPANLWIWDGFRNMPEFPGFARTAQFIPRCGHENYPWGNKPRCAEKWHLPTYCTAYNSIGVMIQAAVMEEASEIILVGCDGYTGGEGPYFTPKYAEVNCEYNNTALWAAHSIAAHSSPVPIYNASSSSIFAGMHTPWRW